MNLHGVVRQIIPAVNPDISIQWYQSTGSTVNSAGVPEPQYAAAVTVTGQIQPVTGQDLRKYEFLQMQGIYRAAYLFGDVEAIVRSASKGGDMLVFPFTQVSGATNSVWLVRQVDETWGSDPSGGGWCRVILVLELDDATTFLSQHP